MLCTYDENRIITIIPVTDFPLALRRSEKNSIFTKLFQHDM